MSKCATLPLVAVWLLLLLFLTHHQANASSDGQKKPCNKMAPVIGQMAMGVDITALDLFPEDQTNDDGFRKTLFDFTCSEGREWVNPTNAEAKFQVPDQVYPIEDKPATSFTTTDHYNDNMDEFKNSLNSKVGLGGSYGPGSFSLSFGYKQSKEKLLKTKESVVETYSTMLAHIVSYKGSNTLLLSQEFKELLAALPPAYENNSAGYDQFVDTFGTHYFDTAKFGGYLQLKTVLDSRYREQTDTNEIDANLHATLNLFANIDASTELKKLDEEKRKNFQRNSYLSFFFFGGKGKAPPGPVTDNDDGGGKDDGSDKDKDKYLLSNSSLPSNSLFSNSSLQANASLSASSDNTWLEKWWGSVTTAPWLFSGKLVPIDSLVTDPVRKVQLKKAILFKQIRAYLLDYKNAHELSDLPLPSETIAKLKEYEQALRDPTKSEAKIAEISKEIEKWFKTFQQKLDELAKNKPDAADKLDHLLRTMYNDKSCECSTNGSKNRTLLECLGNFDQPPKNDKDKFKCKSHTVSRAKLDNILCVKLN